MRRPYLTGAWLSALTLVPYVLWPGDADAWFLARFYFLPVTLYHFTLILFSYFGSVMQWKKWLWPVVLSGVPVALVLLVAVVLAVVPGEQLGGTVLADYLSKHPDATIAEAIEEAGFGSKPAYYAFKAKLQEKK